MSGNALDRDAAFATLKEMPSQQATQLLRLTLNDDDPELRCMACEGLLRVDSLRAMDDVLACLADRESTVRWNTCGLLHDFGDRRAIPGLSHLLTSESEADVRLAAAYALGAVGDSTVIPLLQQTVDRDPGTDGEGRRVADAAIDAIGEIRTRSQRAEGH